jgi:hypothetical protein
LGLGLVLYFGGGIAGVVALPISLEVLEDEVVVALLVIITVDGGSGVPFEVAVTTLVTSWVVGGAVLAVERLVDPEPRRLDPEPRALDPEPRALDPSPIDVDEVAAVGAR